MLIIILALLFGIVVLGLLLRSLSKKREMPSSMIYRVLKILLLAESAVFVIVFVVVLIKTIMT